MKIVIPTNNNKGLDDTVAQHFGRCNTFTFLDEKGNVEQVIDNTGQHMGGKVAPSEILKEHNVDILLCKGLGPRALRFFRETGIEVYVAQANIVRELFSIWKEGGASKASFDDVCEDHKKA